MTTSTLESVLRCPVRELLTIVPYDGSEVWPDCESPVWPLVPKLAGGSIPVQRRGRFWGSLSVYDVIADMALTQRSRHRLETYKLSQLRAGKIGTRAYAPLRADDPLARSLEFFINRGTRRVFLVDVQGSVVGYIDASSLLQLVMGRCADLLMGKTVERLILKKDQGLFSYLATPLTDLVTGFHRFRRSTLVMYGMQPLRELGPTDVLSLMDPDHLVLNKLVKDIVPEPGSGGAEFVGALPQAREALPFATVLTTDRVLDVLEIVSRHQSVYVIDPARLNLQRGALNSGYDLGIIGHIDIMWVLRKIFRWLDVSDSN